MAHARSILLIAAALALAGCASVQKTVDGWLGQTSPSSAGEGTVYFAASDGLVVRDAPSGAARIVGRLALHQRVVRSKLEAGYAYVISDGGGVEGWVDNAQLIWRLPAASTPSSGTTAPAEQPAPGSEPVASPVPTEVPETAPTAVPTPAPAPTSATPTPHKAMPEMFDPY